MPKVLEVTDLTEIAEEEADALTADEEAYEARRYAPNAVAPDLSDGGTVNGVRVRPARDRSVTKGRAVARLAWMWNGTESLLPLMWDTDGKTHDSAKRYFDKRFCLCCRQAGFRGRQCPTCAKKSCEFCNGGNDRAKIIACFYRSREAVPFPTKFYGSIPCFLASCPRQDGQGFLNQEDMRLHARLMHKMEYQAHVEALAASKTDEVAELRQRLDALMANMARRPIETVAVAPIQTVAKVEIPTGPGRKWTKKEKKAASVRAKARIAAAK